MILQVWFALISFFPFVSRSFGSCKFSHSFKMRFLTSVVPLITFGLSQLNSVVAFTQCYYPDGSIPTDWVWEPCTGAQYSSCCVPGEGDICQPDGLCYYPDENLSYRGTCTDRTWNDPSCNANICVTGT